ncbi:MAG: hypothetical protein H0U10_09050 [Chloroflexia bacterium]|nr:hypothetical protein [Chloroflexia bacterium]
MRQIPVLGLLVLLLGAPIPAVARSATPAAAPIRDRLGAVSASRGGHPGARAAADGRHG